MAVLSNNVIAGASIADDAAGGDAYQIEKSLRFNPADSPSLTRKLSSGNRRTWTLSFWCKGTDFDNAAYLISSGASNDNVTAIRGVSHTLRLYWNSGGNTAASIITNRVFRDPSAWYHIVVALDTTQSIAAERVKIYINGKKETSFSTATYPSQNAESFLCDDTYTTNLGSNVTAGGDAYKGYFADVYMIDGLALSPAAFGSFDSTGVWNPKKTTDDDGKFILPAPNDGTTWSSGSITNASSSYPITEVFDTGTITGDNYWLGSVDIVPNDGFSTFTPSNKIECNQSIRIYASAPGNDPIDPYWYVTTADANGVETRKKYEAVVQTSGGNTKWYDVLTGKGELKKIEITHGTAGSGIGIRAIEVDGVQLIDGQTDPTTRNNPNNGTEWSSGTATGTLHGAWANLFNGLTDGTDVAASGNSGASAELTLPSSISWTKKLRVLSWIDHADCKLELTIDGTTTDYADLYNASNQWKTISTTAGSLTKIKLTSQSGTNERARVSAIEVDGHVVIDSSVDNSFHLKFNDTSSNAALGADSLGTETIRKPGGFNTDANSAKLVLAVPGDVTTDVSPSIRGSGSAKSAAAGSGTLAAVSTDQSKFYGSSIKVETDKQVQYTDSTDFDFDTGDCTVEAWVRSTSNSLTLNTPIDARSSGANGFAIFFTNGNAWQVDCTGNSPVSSGTGTAAVNTWYHIALSRASGSLRFFVDGKQIGSTASNTSDWSSGKVTIGHESNQWDFQGFVNDLRVYKGVGKYTANFTPPTRNDWTVNSLTTVAPALTGSSSGTASGGKSMIVKAAGGSTVTGTFNAAGNSTGNINYYKSDNGINWTYIQQDTGESPSYTAKWLSMGGGSAAKQFTSTSGSYQYSLEGSTSLDSNTSSQTIDQTGLTFTGAINYGELDSLVDTPTNYGDEDTGAGGEIRGNYCTWNPLAKTGSSNTLSQGNLKCITTTNACTKGTFAMTSGKWYFEYTLESAATQQIGIIDATGFQDASAPGGDPHNGYIYLTNVSGNANTGHLYHNQTASITTWPSGANGDIVMIAYDADTGKLWWGKDNTWFNDSSGNTGNPATGANPAITVNADYRDRMTPVCGAGGGSDAANGTANFGQRAFKYTAPSGFKALCTQNLPNTFSGAELNNPSKYFDIITYQGTGASKTFSGLGFGPDMIWTKQRSSTGEPRIQDIIRGTNSQIRTNTNADEMTETNNVTAFTSDGYTIGTNGDINSSSHTHVAWLWDAGTAASGANDAGGIDISSGNQWANTTAGFSISRYTGTGSATTVGHGLNAVPEFIFFKRLDGDDSWPVYHKNLSGITKWLALDTSDGEQTRTDEWNEIYPTNTLVSIGPGGRKNENGVLTMMYAFTPIPGYSAFGSYEGNGNADGPFVYCGFKPRWLLIKNVDATNHWAILDTARDTYNGMDERLHPNDSMATNTGAGIVIDTLSNGFKCRNSDGLENGNNQTMIYAAFAEHPFKTARAR